QHFAHRLSRVEHRAARDDRQLPGTGRRPGLPRRSETLGGLEGLATLAELAAFTRLHAPRVRWSRRELRAADTAARVRQDLHDEAQTVRRDGAVVRAEDQQRRTRSEARAVTRERVVERRSAGQRGGFGELARGTRRHELGARLELALL